MNSQGYGKNSWFPPDQAAADEFDQFSIDVPLPYYNGLFYALTTRSQRNLWDDSGGDLNRFLVARIQSMTPTSLIRVSDGEGNVLFGAAQRYENLKRHVLQKISLMHFGSKDVISDNYDQFAIALAASIDSADVVGTPGLNTVIGGFSTVAERVDVRALVGNRYSLYMLGRKAHDRGTSEKIVGNVWFNRNLLPYYSQLLAAASRICIVACYPELVELFRAKIGDREFSFVEVPLQASQSQNKGNDSRHYPGHFVRICERIMEQSSGTVYVVAAGLLGKYYCHLAKKNGGIAIDVGSIADVWMGKRSRPGITDAFVDRWALTNVATTPGVPTST